jgi:uncharacterized protein (TIGR03032 family)
MAQPISYFNTRHFTTWLSTEKVSLIVTSYKTHQVYSISLDDKGEITMWFTNVGRAMGIDHLNGSLWCSNVGNLIKYENKGELVDPDHGKFNTNFVPQKAYFSGDVDVHDLCQTKDGELYYCSALFSCICKPSDTNSFELYWKPPWIDRLAAEDRCHLNGLCLVDDVPKYVTSACRSNESGGWRDIKGKGVVYDIVNEKVVCKDLWNPHSPRWYDGKLWILESGTGYFGYVDLEKEEFVKCCFIPAFLRGMDFIGRFAVVCGSLDRHDHSFGELPLGKALEEKEIKSKCGLWIVNIDTYDQPHYLGFNEPVTELYDVTVVPHAQRTRVFDLSDNTLLNQFYFKE